MTMLKPSNEDQRCGVLPDVETAAAQIGTVFSMGVCRHRCSPLYYRDPVALIWIGLAPASSVACPHCGLALRRTSRHTWGGRVRLLNALESAE